MDTLGVTDEAECDVCDVADNVCELIRTALLFSPSLLIMSFGREGEGFLLWRHLLFRRTRTAALA